MMTLKKAERIHEGLTVMTYEVSHSTPGREGTTLTCDLRMEVASPQITTGRCKVKLDVFEATADTPKEALEKTISYLQRMIEGIEKRRETWIPI